MDKKIIFCNIAWMKYYEGIYDDDKPMNGGKYVDVNNRGGECYNFQDYNGKCYGYFMIYGNLALENHFEGVRSTDKYVDDVMVIWVATNSKQETRIVGWYENARLYRSFQGKIRFTDLNNSFYYNIVADAKDCYLIPEDKRTFPIERAGQSGAGTGMGRSNIWYAESKFARTILVPKVLDYIKSYNDDFANIVYSKEDFSIEFDNSEKALSYNDLIIEGIKFVENNDYYTALTYFNTARSIKETDEVLYQLGRCYYCFMRVDKALEMFHSIGDKDEWNKEILISIMELYDILEDREKTVAYGYKMLDSLGDTESEIGYKLFAYEVLIAIFISKKDYVKAEGIMEDLSSKYHWEKAQEIVEFQKKVIQEQKNLVEI